MTDGVRPSGLKKEEERDEQTRPAVFQRRAPNERHKKKGDGRKEWKDGRKEWKEGSYYWWLVPMPT